MLIPLRALTPRVLLFLVTLLLFLPAPHTRAQTPAPPSNLPASSPPISRAYDFYGHGPYRKNVPRPSAILGYEAGERHSTFREQEMTLLAIAKAASDRVRVEEIGKSVEGRPLRLFLVSAPENIARLDAIRARIGKLADPRLLANDGGSRSDRPRHAHPHLDQPLHSRQRNGLFRDGDVDAVHPRCVPRSRH